MLFLNETQNCISTGKIIGSQNIKGVNKLLLMTLYLIRILIYTYVASLYNCLLKFRTRK